MEKENKQDYILSTEKNCISHIYNLLKLETEIKDLFQFCENCQLEENAYL
jgi:hypothetical protein